MALTENRRIFWNIIFTYGRSLLAIAGALFVSRWVLMALGQVDYGLFSVIGGLVVFIQFFNNVLAGATARFYAFSIGAAKADKDFAHGLEECRKWFNTALTIHTVLPLCLIILGYPVAKWAIYNWLTIPPERMEACVWVLRFTCLSSFVAMVNVPFMAMYTAKQYIAELTVYSMTTTVLNIIFAYFMASHPGSWLIKYALWMCAMSVLPQLIICIRANIIFQECKLVWGYMGNTAYLKQIGGYVCWTSLGHIAALLRSQGISLLINKAFGPRINASMQVAHQVQAGTSTLSSALLKAFSPAITTAAGAKDYKRMTALAFGACKFSTLLALIFVIPLCLELPYVVELWLKNPPPFTVGLCYFMLTYYICGVCTTGNMLVVLASGKIKEYHIVLTVISLCILPVSILAVYLGGTVYSIGAILVVGNCLNSAGRIYFAQKILNMSAMRWVREVLVSIVGLIVICGSLAWLPHLWMRPGLVRLFITIILAEMLFFPLSWFLVLTNEERAFITDKLTTMCQRLCTRYPRLLAVPFFKKIGQVQSTVSTQQLYLRKLAVTDGHDVFDMLKTITAEENAFTNPVYNMNFVQFKEWLVQQEQWAQNKELPPGFVGQCLYWLFDGPTPVGVGKIRYELTPSSRHKGGNIGYAISSPYRGKGYGNKILKLLLQEAKNLKLKEVLLTVEKYNYPSKKVIEKNGGILFDETDERWYFKF